MSSLLGAAPHPEHDAVLNVTYEVVGGNSASSSLLCKSFRIAAVIGLIVALVGVAGDQVISRWIGSMDIAHRSFVQSSMRSQDIQDKYPQAPAALMNGQFRWEPTCPNDGSVCICSGGYHVTGRNKYGYNEVAKDPGSTACQAWKFKIGDIILVAKPSGKQRQYWQADIVARWTGSNIVHNAIVASVPPEGVVQNGKNIILIEALKGNIKKVVQNTLQELVERYPFGAVHIRRVDPAKYPSFYTPQVRETVKRWLLDRVNEGFDLAMVNPLKRAILARARYVPIDPWCADKTWAIKMYQDGGPHQWICSELVAWTIAFPGGLNMNPANKDPWCKYPTWIIKNLQPNPGDFLTAKWVQQIPWKMPCEELGCFVAVPPPGAPLAASRVHTPLSTSTTTPLPSYTTVATHTTPSHTTLAPQSTSSNTTVPPNPCAPAR